MAVSEGHNTANSALPPLLSPERTTLLNNRPRNRTGRCVIYWLQNSQRLHDNPALATADSLAHDLGLPTLLWIALTPLVPNGSIRSARFMLDGLRDLTDRALARGYGVHIAWACSPADLARQFAAGDPAVIVTDVSHLARGRSQRATTAALLDVPLLAVDGDLVVPANVIPGPQIAARTFRPRVWQAAERFLDESFETAPARPWPTGQPDPWQAVGEVASVTARIGPFEVQPLPETLWPSGERAALARLEAFIATGLHGYATARREPELNASARLSPYLRFGQISPRQIVRRVRASDAPASDVTVFLDELVVRRELAANYTWYEPRYARFSGLPSWAQQTLLAHAGDQRSVDVSEAQIEAGETGDPYFDAAMRELRYSGVIHNIARMYWGKQILAWLPDPRRARAFAQLLNDRYALDGRSPNAFANVAWCFGLHDRPWPERAVFGKVRSMTFNSSARKIDLTGYITRVAELERAASGSGL